jgi:hypothetical protein
MAGAGRNVGPKKRGAILSHGIRPLCPSPGIFNRSPACDWMLLNAECLIACVKILITTGIAIPGLANARRSVVLILSTFVHLTVLSRFLS